MQSPPRFAGARFAVRSRCSRRRGNFRRANPCQRSAKDLQERGCLSGSRRWRQAERKVRAVPTARRLQDGRGSDQPTGLVPNFHPDPAIMMHAPTEYIRHWGVVASSTLGNARTGAACAAAVGDIGMTGPPRQLWRAVAIGYTNLLTSIVPGAAVIAINAELPYPGCHGAITR